jgi:hypothetical protein
MLSGEPHLEQCLLRRPHRRAWGWQVLWGLVAGSHPPWLACRQLLLRGRRGRRGGGGRDPLACPSLPRPAVYPWRRGGDGVGGGVLSVG